MKYIYLILILIFLVACSADVTNEPKDYSDETISKINKDKAVKHFIDGSLLSAKGRYAEAILEYQQALKYDNTAGINYAVSKDFLRLNKLPQARDYGKRAVSLDSTNTEYLNLLATIYTTGRNFDSATVIFEKIVQIDSTDFQALFSLAKLYEKDKPQEALNLYDKIIKEAGPQWNVLLNVADLNERLGNVEATIKTVEELLDLNPTNLDLKKLLIESYIKTAKYDKAIKLCDESLTVFPDDFELIEYRANAFVQNGKWNEGAVEYKKLVESDVVAFENKLRIITGFLTQVSQDTSLLSLTKDMLYHLDKDTTDWQVKAYLGQIFIDEGNDSLAINYLKDASKLAVWNSQIWMRLGGLLFDTGKYEEAIVEMRKAVQNFPNEYVINVILGLALAQEQQHKEAGEYLKRSVDLNPTDVLALQAYGFTLNQLDKPEEALVYLNRAVELEPENTQVLGVLGLIYDDLEMYTMSDSVYHRALTIDPLDALVNNNYAYALAERGTRLDEALEMAKKAIDVDPDNSSFLDTIGWIYYKLGDLEKAKINIEKAMITDPDNPTLLHHIGDVYYKMGMSDKALEFWKKALELGEEDEDLLNKVKGNEND